MVARHLEVAEQTYHWWRAQCGGMKADDETTAGAGDKENQRLEKIVADQELDIDISKEFGNF